MHEQFTDRARTVMQLANEEALKMRHEYVGTEHILLGLIQDTSCTAIAVLKKFGVEPDRIRKRLLEIVPQGTPDAYSEGKLPHTPRAKNVVRFAVQESTDLDDACVGTEHLLLGILRETEGYAATTLMNLGLRLEDIREEVLNMRMPTPEESLQEPQEVELPSMTQKCRLEEHSMKPPPDDNSIGDPPDDNHVGDSIQIHQVPPGLSLVLVTRAVDPLLIQSAVNAQLQNISPDQRVAAVMIYRLPKE